MIKSANYAPNKPFLKKDFVLNLVLQKTFQMTSRNVKIALKTAKNAKMLQLARHAQTDFIVIQKTRKCKIVFYAKKVDGKREEFAIYVEICVWNVKPKINAGDANWVMGEKRVNA